ncbi:hypothetical protein GCM10022221_63320 [Actinocorallia aurea]
MREAGGPQGKLARPGLVALALTFVAALDTDALTAPSILVLVAHQAGKTSAWRAHLLATSYDALGHAASARPGSA